MPGDTRNWNSRAVTWTHINTPHVAECVEYYTLAIFRPWQQTRRALRLVEKIESYRFYGDDLVLVGHSNGCDVILDALDRLDFSVKVKQVHLVCGACESNFQKNGLNNALHRKSIGEVFIYIAGKDSMLRLARSVPGKVLGFGTLGLHGAVKADPALINQGRITERRWPGYSHSECWTGGNFHDTMQQIVIS